MNKKKSTQWGGEKKYRRGRDQILVNKKTKNKRIIINKAENKNNNKE